MEEEVEGAGLGSTSNSRYLLHVGSYEALGLLFELRESKGRQETLNGQIRNTAVIKLC